MFINEKLDIRKATNGEHPYHINGRVVLDINGENELNNIYNVLRSNGQREKILKDYLATGSFPYLKSVLADMLGITEEKAEEVLVELTEKEKTIRGIENLMNFFKEFSFEPNFRFLNTMSIKFTENKKSAKEYIKQYFELIDSPYCNEINAKVSSKEFNSILDDVMNTKPTHEVNSRFKLYYGSQGTGKTTIAMKETSNRCVVCNSSMLPSDLMEDFVFVDGKATFKPSALWRCMENGEKIVLDEINLLPFDSLRFLQGILDGKTEFEYKGNTVHIKDGFMIIGTMNLTVNGMTYGLPEPLVDRCADTKKFVLGAETLFSAIA